MLGDIRDPRLMYLKAGLFVLLGLMAAAGILVEAPRLKVALLLALAVWSFARAYYFAFYVVEHYIDPAYRFDGLWSFARHAIGRARAGAGQADPGCPDGRRPRS